MRDLISDFNSMEGDSDYNSNDDNSNSIPIPELARNSNSGAELTPALIESTSINTM